MKNRIIILVTLVFLLAACNGKNEGGSGKIITEQREVSGFTKVLVAGSGKVQIIQGDRESLTIEAEDKVMPLIESKVTNGVLTLSQKSSANISLAKPINYTVTMIDVTGFEVTGSAELRADRVDASILTLTISGSGGINIAELDGDSVDAEITGSGNITAKGDIVDQVVEVSGSGEYRAADLRSATAEVSVGGSGNAEVWVDTTLSATVSGSGNIRYYGEPILTQSVTGSGNVRSQGAK